jgi:SAM-dependent methyltransferase
MANSAFTPSDSVKPGSYDPAYFSPLFAIEDRHFWFRARNNIIATLAAQTVTRLSPGYRMLEVGCGTGNVLRVLKQTCQKGVVMGMDLFVEGLRYAQQRTPAPLLQGDMHAPPFATSFEVIGIFDVLEHLPDDLRVLADLYNMLAPDGVLLLTVPAHMSLWSYFDEASHHCRRYELGELERKLVTSGYQVEFISHYMAGIFPLVWLWRRLAALIDRRSADSVQRTHELAHTELRIVPVINELITALLRQETLLLAHRSRLPFGTSLLAVARKN